MDVFAMKEEFQYCKNYYLGGKVFIYYKCLMKGL
jgi:hypothetical protein